MPTDVSPLFEELKVKGKLMRNRIVMPPMVTVRNIAAPDGVAWYGEHAKGGVALVIVEATAVGRFGGELTGETLRPLVEAIHDGGALAAIQLFPVPFDFPRTDPLPAPADFTLEEIRSIVDQYAAAVEICGDAGFDGVEPHGAHNYPINRFFSPVQNTRSDEYAGGIENRMRFALEIAKAVRPVCDRHEMLLLYRHTAVGKGYGIGESLVLAEALVNAGVDVLDISPASDAAPGDLAAPFMRIGVPVVAVNELDEVDRALEVLNGGRADLVAVGRGLISDPEWALKVQAGRTGDIVKCTRCNEMCFGHLRTGEPIACAEWPQGGPA